ncbi:hypothetical protein PMAYCL1PPCAC_03187, partial [Pristionchus mayeri]
AQVCYEKQLLHYVSTALIECARGERGRDKAIEIDSTVRENEDAKTMWEPLVSHCSALLRSLKMEKTNSRLNRLSDLWNKSEHGIKLTGRLREAIKHVVCNSAESLERANRDCKEILDWIELYSIQHAPMQDLTHFPDDRLLQSSKRNIIIVDASETFSEAETFLHREVCKDGRIHVIIGNEDDAVRFYKRIIDKFASYGVQLNWREKTYGRKKSPQIEIGSFKYFTSKRSETSDRIKNSVVFLHAEQTIAEPFDSRFEPGSLDEFLAELYVVSTVTMEHFNEILDTAKRNSHNLLRMIKSWPSEYQVLEENLVMNLWYKIYPMYASPQREEKFEKHLQKYTTDLIITRIKQYATLAVAQNLRGHVDQHCSKFVRSALVARACE